MSRVNPKADGTK